LFVGEQPGDQEDLQGHPFVGPAGKMLDRALAEIKLDRKEVFLTNAVKHFKWKPAPRGKRRLHARPGAREVHACLPWLQREIALVKPRVIVCLGATASQALLGGKFKLTENRGKLLRETGLASAVVVTTHPSAILRMPDSQSRRQAFKDFVADLKVAARQSRRPA
jgi:DNA polymerase